MPTSVTRLYVSNVLGDTAHEGGFLVFGVPRSVTLDVKHHHQPPTPPQPQDITIVLSL